MLQHVSVRLPVQKQGRGCMDCWDIDPHLCVALCSVMSLTLTVLYKTKFYSLVVKEQEKLNFGVEAGAGFY